MLEMLIGEEEANQKVFYIYTEAEYWINSTPDQL